MSRDYRAGSADAEKAVENDVDRVRSIFAHRKPVGSEAWYSINPSARASSMAANAFEGTSVTSPAFTASSIHRASRSLALSYRGVELLPNVAVVEHFAEGVGAGLGVAGVGSPLEEDA